MKSLSLKYFLAFTFLIVSQLSNNLFGQNFSFELHGQITDSSNTGNQINECKIFVYNEIDLVAITKTYSNGKYRLVGLNPNLKENLKLKLRFLDKNGNPVEKYIPDELLKHTQKQIREDVSLKLDYDLGFHHQDMMNARFLFTLEDSATNIPIFQFNIQEGSSYHEGNKLYTYVSIDKNIEKLNLKLTYYNVDGKLKELRITKKEYENALYQKDLIHINLKVPYFNKTLAKSYLIKNRNLNLSNSLYTNIPTKYRPLEKIKFRTKRFYLDSNSNNPDHLKVLESIKVKADGEILTYLKVDSLNFDVFNKIISNYIKQKNLQTFTNNFIAINNLQLYYKSRNHYSNYIIYCFYFLPNNIIVLHQFVAENLRNQPNSLTDFFEFELNRENKITQIPKHIISDFQKQDSSIHFFIPQDELESYLTNFCIKEDGTYYNDQHITNDTSNFKFVTAKYGLPCWQVNNCLYIGKNAFPAIDVKSLRFHTILEDYAAFTYIIDTNAIYLWDFKEYQIKLPIINTLNRKYIQIKNGIICDNLQCFLKDKQLIYNQETVTFVGNIFYKTKKNIVALHTDYLTNNIILNNGGIVRSSEKISIPYAKYNYTKEDELFIELLDVDVNSFKSISNYYFYDKNGVYYQGHKLDALVSDTQNFKIITLNNYIELFSDGKHIFNKMHKTKLDVKTFNVLNNDLSFDKNGIYIHLTKLPFNYPFEISLDSMKLIGSKIILGNEIIDIYHPERTPYKLDKTTRDAILTNEKFVRYNYYYTNKKREIRPNLYIENDSIFFKGKYCSVDYNSFREIGYNFYDKNYFYVYNSDEGLNIMEGVDSPISTRIINRDEKLFFDQKFVYFDTMKLFSNKKFEYIKSVSLNNPYKSLFIKKMSCGFDSYLNRTFYSDYILKNEDGIWYITIVNTSDNTKKKNQKVYYKKMNESFLSQLDILINQHKIILSENLNN